MDCRSPLWLLVAWICAALGCVHSHALPLSPEGSAGGPHQADLSPAPSRNLELSEDDRKAATQVAIGQFQERSASHQPNLSPAQRQQLREQARQNYQQALAISPKYMPAHMALAKFYAATGDHERATTTYRKALKIDPKNAALWHNYGMTQAQHKDWDAATQSLLRAAELDPDNCIHAKSLGFCLARAGRIEESFVCLNNAVGEAEAHYQLARMAHHLGQHDACRQRLHLALQANPQLEPARQMLASLTSTAPTSQPNASPAP